MSEDIQRDEYLAERKLLIDAEREGATQYDKVAISLASGALALSLIFIREIAPQPIPWTIWPLIVSWVSLATSMCCTLSSFLSSQRWCRIERDNLDKAYSEGIDRLSQKNCWMNVTRWLNRLSLISLMVGVIGLGVFSIENLRRGVEQVSDQARTNDSTGEDNRRRLPTPNERKVKGAWAGTSPPASTKKVVKPAEQAKDTKNNGGDKKE